MKVTHYLLPSGITALQYFRYLSINSMQPLFITGIGTGIGKTVVSAIVAEGLQADYWKPVQAGYEEGTDSEWVRTMISDQLTIHPEVYKLKLPASPHIAAREEGIRIDLEVIEEQFIRLSSDKPIVIEGAGGLLVPLNEEEFVIDLIKRLNAKVILVSRNYLGSINHSLLTAEVCKREHIEVIGWVFNDQYLHYEEEISKWSGYKILGRIPFADSVNKDFIKNTALAVTYR